MAESAGRLPPTGVLTLRWVLTALSDDGLITPEQARALGGDGDDSEQHPLLRVAAQGWRSATPPGEPLGIERLTRWLAERAGLEYLRIDPLRLDLQGITGLVSQAYATRFRLLPVAATEQEVTVATSEPFVREWEPELTRILRRPIRRVVANPADIERYRAQFYGVSRSLAGADAGSPNAGSQVTNFEQLTQLGRVGEPDANDQHIVHLVDWLLQYAFEQRASDIHLEPRRDEGRIRLRIDGALHLVHQVPVGVMTAIITRLKALGRMNVADRRRPQDGRVRSRTPAGEEVELRLSTMPTTFGEKLVARIFDPAVLTRSFAELGFSAHDRAAWERIVDNPYGVILVTGPTGSGKTTTLYCALKRLARPELNICTIEDPIEMVEPQFNQMQVQPAIGLDFASGVRTLMRQDPDIIMVGEIRDRETAEVAIQAALTGHLVLSTLHTNDAPSAVTRLLDIGVPAYLIAATLTGVVAQRLVRTLCPHCRRPAPLDADAWRELTAPYRVRAPQRVYAAVGCDECRHTGYLGRTGIYEILVMDEPLRALVRPGLDLGALRRQALANGLQELRIAGARKVAAGATTVEEVLAVVATR